VPAPTTYTEVQLAAYMKAELGTSAEVLGWENIEQDGPYQEAVNDALLAYDVGDIADASDIIKLRVLASVAVWRRAVRAIADKIDVEIGGQKVNASKMQAQFAVALQQAEQVASDLAPETTGGGNYTIGVGSLNLGNSPYRNRRRLAGGGYIGFWDPGSAS
jgi:hypothetical protein